PWRSGQRMRSLPKCSIASRRRGRHSKSYLKPGVPSVSKISSPTRRSIRRNALAGLASERDGRDAVVFPDSLLNHRDDPEVAQIIEGERKLFDLRQTARSGQKAQLRQQIEQLREEIVGRTGP